MLPVSVVKNANIVIDPPVGEYCVVRDISSKQYFRLGYREASFLQSLDGSVNLIELCAKNCSGFTAQEVEAMLAKFQEFRLTGADITSDPAGVIPSSRTRKIMQSIFKPGNIRFHLADPNIFLDKHIAAIHRLFSRTAISVYLLLIALPLILLIAMPALLGSAALAIKSEFSALEWGGLYVAMLIVIALHELAHAAACKHFGGAVHKIGVMLMYMQPVAYCDISDSWRFDTVEKKIATAFAGIFLQLVVSSIATVVWAATGYPILLYFAGINAAVALLNFFPFIKLDGYWMLVHLLDEPNLRQKSINEVVFATRLHGRTAKAIRPALLIFGIASILAAVLFAGLGLYTIHKYSTYVSEYFSMFVTSLFAVVLLARTVLFTRGLLRSTIQTRS